MKIDAAPHFTVTVSVQLPGEAAQTFTARYRVMPVSEFSGYDTSEPDQVKALVTRLVVDLGDIEDESGKKLPFTPALLDAVCDQPHLRGALLRGYMKGVSDAARGN
jgi:hypothetical protein